MKFIAGAPLSAAIKKLVQDGQRLDAAVAYWGKDALKLLNLSARRKSIRIICCLKNGKSDPDIIARFKRRAKQNDRLHAKVFLTEKAAIIGSANASSNGLPEEENHTKRLIEAGVLTKDPKILAQISQWFEREFKDARRINAIDIKNAKDARRRRLWDGTHQPPQKRSLIEAIASGKSEFLQQEIYFTFCDTYIAPKDFKEAKKWAKNNNAKIKKKIVMPDLKWTWLDFYEGWPAFPLESHLIDIFRDGKKITVSGPTKTFGTRIRWKNMQYVLTSKRVEFGYKITNADRKIIKSASKKLWTAAHKKSRRGVLPLSIAAPILLKFANQ